MLRHTLEMCCGSTSVVTPELADAEALVAHHQCQRPQACRAAVHQPLRCRRSPPSGRSPAPARTSPTAFAPHRRQAARLARIRSACSRDRSIAASSEAAAAKPRSNCQAGTGATVAQLPDPRPQPVSRLPEPPCQACPGTAHGRLVSPRCRAPTNYVDAGRAATNWIGFCLFRARFSGRAGMGIEPRIRSLRASTNPSKHLARESCPPASGLSVERSKCIGLTG
jgi:hypothetical protein